MRGRLAQDAQGSVMMWLFLGGSQSVAYLPLRLRRSFIDIESLADHFHLSGVH